MLTAVLLALALVGIFVVAPSARILVAVVVFTRKWSQQAERARNHLFFETDYQELLAACRELLRQMPSDEGSRQYRIHLGNATPKP